MKFTCERGALHEAASTVSKAASPRSTIPALEGILLETMPEGFIKLTGYDLKKGIYTKIPAEVAEHGKIVLNARMFGNIVNALPEGTVSMRSENQNVRIQCLSADFNILGSDAADYPELPEIDGHAGVSLPQDILSRMIRQTIFAVSDNETRPVYTGELFEIGGGCLTMVAVDGYRLAMRRETVEGVENDHRFIVPGSALSDLEKLCGDDPDPVRIHLGSKHISFTIGDTVLVTRRLEGDFLDYRKTVPREFRYTVGADRAELQRVVERVSLVIDDRIRYPLRCSFGNGELRIACSTALGKAEDFCAVDGDGGGLEIGFNNRYLLDCLKAIGDERIRVGLNSGSTPCVLLPPEEGGNYAYMILPVRLKAE